MNGPQGFERDMAHLSEVLAEPDEQAGLLGHRAASMSPLPRKNAEPMAGNATSQTARSRHIDPTGLPEQK